VSYRASYSFFAAYINNCLCRRLGRAHRYQQRLQFPDFFAHGPNFGMQIRLDV